MVLKYDCLDFLQNSTLPWIKYNMELDKNGSSQYAQQLKSQLLQDERIVNLFKECRHWGELPLKRHNDAKHIFHKMHLLTDLGLDYNDAPMREIIDRILQNQSTDGAFMSLVNIPKNFGGSSEDEMVWLICDFPLLLYTVIKAGLQDDDRVKKGAEFLASQSSEVGWRCVGSLPKFRGPGRKDDYCPFATLISLRAFSLLPQYHGAEFIKNGIDSILNQWKHQGERKIYMFGIGTDFRKLKYPNIWFDIVHVVRVLSKYKYAVEQKEYKQMLQIIIDKQMESGGFIPQSIYMAYKGWDFGQKKTESESLTYQIYKIFNE